MIKTAESVTAKHPDKMCDQISDAILDFCLAQDPQARVAVETMGGHGKVKVMGELTFNGELHDMDIKKIVTRITGDENLDVEKIIVKQSREIANGVDTGGAGDQGIMVGYACTDNDKMIPQEKYLADSLKNFLYAKKQVDGKTQITMDGDRVTTIVASFCTVKKAELEAWVGEWIYSNPTFLVDDFKDVKIHANPAGDWDCGGFEADTGLTGRKIIVDAYGPAVAVGGGAFSGKDPSKVDRSGAYMARKIAIDTMRQFQAKECLVKIAYAIGVDQPVMAVAFITSKSGIVSEHKLMKKEIANYLTPKGIREFLELDKPIYEQTAREGHFGTGKYKWDC